MRAPRFLHVGIAFAQVIPDLTLLDAAIDSESFDWFRYSHACYVLWTPSDSETICRKILRVPGMENSSVFVCSLNMDDGFGMLPHQMWDWLKKDRGNGPLLTWTPSDMVQPSTPPQLPGLPPPPPKLR